MIVAIVAGSAITQCDFYRSVCVVCINSDKSLQQLLTMPGMNWNGFVFYLHPFIYNCPSLSFDSPVAYIGNNTQYYIHYVCARTNFSIRIESMFTNVSARVGPCNDVQAGIVTLGTSFVGSRIAYVGTNGQPFITVARNNSGVSVQLTNVTAAFIMFDVSPGAITQLYNASGNY